MKLLLVLLGLALAGCQTAPLAPTAVDPAINQFANNLMVLVAASNGVCTLNFDAGTTSVAAACTPVADQTSTLQATGATFQTCIASGGAGIINTRVMPFLVGLKAQLCATAPPVPVVTAPAAPAPAVGGGT